MRLWTHQEGIKTSSLIKSFFVHRFDLSLVEPKVQEFRQTEDKSTVSPWIQTINNLLIFTILAQVVTRSLSGGGYGVGSTAQQKDLPPIPNGGASPFGGPVPRLWSQGFGAPGAVGTVPGNTTNQITPPRIPGTSFGANRLNLSPLGDNLGYMAGETPARFRGSPSRLREAFDSSL